MAKICIIVGHGKSKNGGYDSGAVSKDSKYHEFEIAKEIARHCVDYLNANYDVDVDLMNYDGSLYLTDRIKAVNKDNYNFIAEIHLNAGGGTGTEVFYYHGSPTSKKYAEAISKYIAETFGVTNRGAKVRLNSNGKDYFAIIRDTKPTAVLVETLFIDTASDLEKVKTADGQKKCGIAIAKGIATAGAFNAKPVKQPENKPRKLYRVCEGAYSDYDTAVERKNAMIKAGFKNAYIVEV